MALRKRDYSTVAKIDGPHQLSAAACRKTAFEPYRWTFPFAALYLGYFQYADAAAHARRLEKKGWDVHVAGAAAYNTRFGFPTRSPSPPFRTRSGSWPSCSFTNCLMERFISKQDGFQRGLASFIGETGRRNSGGPVRNASLELAEFHSFRKGIDFGSVSWRTSAMNSMRLPEFRSRCR